MQEKLEKVITYVLSHEFFFCKLHANSAALSAGSAKMRAIKRKIVKEQQVPNIYRADGRTNGKPAIGRGKNE